MSERYISDQLHLAKTTIHDYLVGNTRTKVVDNSPNIRLMLSKKHSHWKHLVYLPLQAKTVNKANMLTLFTYKNVRRFTGIITRPLVQGIMEYCKK